jgi:hypothetical protein
MDEKKECKKRVEKGIKDIVQPKKRGVWRGTNRFVSTSYTIADVFFEHLKG